jgi:hypothetical protein
MAINSRKITPILKITTSVIFLTIIVYSLKNEKTSKMLKKTEKLKNIKSIYLCYKK